MRKLKNDLNLPNKGITRRGLEQQQGKNMIYKIRNPKTQKVCSDSEDIQHAFELYYKDLYTQPAMADITTIETFLSSLEFIRPTIYRRIK